MKTLRFFLVGFVILHLTLLAGRNASAQKAPLREEPVTGKYWLELIQDPEVNFYEARDLFNSYWEGRTDFKSNGYKVFKRWEYINEPRVLPGGKLQAPGYVRNEYKRYLSRLDGPASAAGNWSIQGPVAYPTNNTGQPTGMGRINAIAFHPTDPNTIYIGSPSGGIWKTTDGGTNWTNLASNLPKLGVSAILVNPLNPDIVYIGTGDRDAADAPGIGIYKTTDGGTSWTDISGSMGEVTVNAMIMHPSDPDIILAATSGGIYKTTNGGDTWEFKFFGGNSHKDIQFKPGNPAIVYSTRISSGSARFYRSANTGETWTEVGAANGVPLAGPRMVIGVTSANPNLVYLLQIKSSDNTFSALLRSTDSGQNFTTMSSGPNLLGYNCDGSGTASQATYDLCITVDPLNENTVYVGGINTWKSNDGGASWSIKTVWAGNCSGTAVALHADHHVYTWSPGSSPKLFLGHDGGISFSANGGNTWTELSGGLSISQIYKIGQGAASGTQTLIGCQDNGSAATTDGNSFFTTRGGDGTECLIDYSNANYCYNTYVFGEINRSVTGPAGSYSVAIAADGINGIDESGDWVTPFFLHKTDPNTMFFGYNNVWRSNNVRSSPPTWTKISTGETSSCKVLEQSPANVNIVYVVRNGAIMRTDNANDPAASVTWTSCDLPDGYTPTDMKAHPTNADVVYATAGYGVYKSTDRGATWTSLDPGGTLPGLFTNCLVYDKNSNEGIYIGNQTGVWYKDASMTDWMLFSNGLPPVDVRELEIFYDPVGTQNRIKAGTYGRGLWQSDLIETGILNPVDFTATTVNQNQILLSWTPALSLNNIVLAYNTTPTFGTPADGTTYTTGSSIPGGGTVLYSGSNQWFVQGSLSGGTRYYYKLWSINPGTVYSPGTTANASTFSSYVTSFPWSESFENSGSLPAIWTQENVNGTNPWEAKTAGTNSHPASAHTGTYLARCRTLQTNAGYVTRLISPPMNLSCLSSPVLTFWHTQEYWAGQDELRVYYRTSLTGAWTLLAAYTNSIASWTQETISLPNATPTYYIAFQGTVNAGYGICLDDIQISGTYVPYWTGNISNDWNNAANWKNGTVPSSGSNVIIPIASSYPEITLAAATPAQCNDLTIRKGAVLTINPGKSLTVNGTLTNNSGVPGIVIKSDATLTGSLISSTPGIKASIQKFVSHWTDDNHGWHFLSSPVAEQYIQPEFVPGTTPIGATQDFYAWDEPNGYWFNSKSVAGNWVPEFESQFIPGKGYLVAYQSDMTKTFSGEINVSTISRSGLTYTPGPYSGFVTPGWNLLGNPFSSPLVWHSGWTVSNINTVAKIWKESYASYSDINPGEVIPAMQGFMVNVLDAAGGSVAIPSDARIHSSQAWYKSATFPEIKLIVHDQGNATAQESRVIFDPAASTGYDPVKDSPFFPGYAPAFYSRKGEQSLSTNRMPPGEGNTEVFFDFIKGSGTDYSLEAVLSEEFKGDVFLTDLKTDETWTVREHPVHLFTASDGDNPSRFILTFRPVGIHEQQGNPHIIFASENDLCVLNSGDAQLEMFSMSGKVLLKKQLSSPGMVKFRTDLPTGYYLVRLTTDKDVAVSRVFIK